MKVLKSDSKSNSNINLQAFGGVDKLYCFADIKGSLYQNFFNSLNDFKNDDIVFKNDDFKFCFLGSSNIKSGFVGYFLKLFRISENEAFPIARIGFKNPNKQHNVFNCYIQLEGSGIYLYGVLKCCDMIVSLLNSMFNCGVSFQNIQVSKVDVNAFVNYNFDFVNEHSFRTSLSKVGTACHFYGSRVSKETLYLGNRKSLLSFKIYNKVKELLDTEKDISTFIKVDYLKKCFSIDNASFCDFPIWNIEFSYKREILKQFDIFTLDTLLNSVVSLFDYGMQYVELLNGSTEDLKNARKNSNLNRFQVSEVWNNIRKNVEFSNFDFGDDEIKRTITQSQKASKEYFLIMINSQFKKMRECYVSLSFDEIYKLYKEWF